MNEPSKEIARPFVDKAMFEAAPMMTGAGGRVEPRVFLLSATPDPLGAIAAMCRMYEGKPTYTLDDITGEERIHYWDQVQKTHLKAPLEAVHLHFFIEGVTRSFTHQMVRQRTAVYAQESLRFAVKEDMASEVALPPSIPADPESKTYQTWVTTMGELEDVYNFLIDEGVPAEDARGLLPHAVTTRINYVTNLRALLDHAGNRLCTQAQFEWRAVFIELVKAIDEYTPVGWDEVGVASWQFNHIARSQVFKPVCFALGHCPFTAEFDRGCTIRDRVQAGEFDKIDPAEYMADPNAGRVR